MASAVDRGDLRFLQGGGEMGERIRQFDWSQTPIGPIESWSPSLQMMVSFLVVNRFPLLLWWGPQYVSLYNDAYAPILGAKHPDRALGLPVSECWPEIWHVLKPLIDTPFQGGPATWMEDIELEINRHGYPEETHFTIAYSPVPDQSVPSGIGGVLATVHEITQKVIGERRIVALRDALAESERHKDEFLSTLAHELRNPLAPLRTGLDVLVRSREKPDIFNKTSELMQRQLRHMVRLVDELLDLSRVSRGLVELKSERLDVASLQQQASDMARPLLDERLQTLRVSTPGGSVQVLGDSVRLCQILVNLLNNAAKYTEPRGTITLTAEAHDNEVCICVVDNGIGISQEALPHVFDMFSQVSRSFDTTRGGLGIGLALVRQLVQLHGGRIEASSEGLGHGSKFVVWLPRLRSDEGRQKADDAEQPKLAPGHRLRVLVCDDNPDVASILVSLLEVLGHEPSCAFDGESAIEQAGKIKPDLVFLDIGMPGLDGYETCRRMRALPGGSEMAIVAVTGWGSAEAQARCKEAGFSTHVLKPPSFERLEEIIASVPLPSPEARSIT